MDWSLISPRIVWNRCKRRQWPKGSFLAFTPEERQKRRNVLLYCWAGQGLRKTQEGSFPIHAETCFWSRPGWNYSVEQNPDLPLGITAIHFDLMDNNGHVLNPDALPLPPESVNVTQPALVESITTWIADLALDSRSGVGPSSTQVLAATHALHGLLIQLAEDNPADQGSPSAMCWRSVTRFIQSSLQESINVAGLSRHFGYTRSHFSRMFSQNIGLGPQQYIINARIALAKELLRETQLSIGDVAFHAGYSDVFRFSKQFRRHVGCTPTQYRMSGKMPT